MSIITIDYGLDKGQLKWVQGFRASRNDKNEWKGSESFECLKSDLTSLLPLKGAPCEYPGFSFMTATEVDVENLPGGYDRVNVKYAGVGSEGDFTFDDEDYEEEFDKYNYDLSITTSTEPIETHPKFRDISLEDREIIFNILNGNLTRSEAIVADELSEPYKFYRKDEPQAQNNSYDISDDTDAQALVDYILNGVLSYLRARQIWRVSYNAPGLPAANILNHVGYIATAKGAPALADDRNWLFSGVDASFQDGMCATTLEWILSESGGWDSYLYTKP